MITLARYNWSTQQRELVPVDVPILQEIVDVLFRSTKLWEESPELFERKLRHWQSRLFAQPAIVPAQPASTPVTPITRREPDATVLALVKAGKTNAEIKKETGLSLAAIKRIVGEAA